LASRGLDTIPAAGRSGPRSIPRSKPWILLPITTSSRVWAEWLRMISNEQCRARVADLAALSNDLRFVEWFEIWALKRHEMTVDTLWRILYMDADVITSSVHGGLWLDWCCLRVTLNLLFDLIIWFVNCIAFSFIIRKWGIYRLVQLAVRTLQYKWTSLDDIFLVVSKVAAFFSDNFEFFLPVLVCQINVTQVNIIVITGNGDLISHWLEIAKQMWVLQVGNLTGMSTSARFFSTCSKYPTLIFTIIMQHLF